MDDPILCCLAGVCCPPLKRSETIAAYIADLTGADEAHSRMLADDLIRKFDESSLGALIKSIAENARQHPKKGQGGHG